MEAQAQNISAGTSEFYYHILKLALTAIALILIVDFEFKAQAQQVLVGMNEAVRFSPNFSEIAETQIMPTESLLTWGFVLLFLVIFARLLGFGLLTSLLFLSAAFMLQRLNLPVLRLLYAQSALATTAATAFFLVAAVRSSKNIFSKEFAFLGRYLQKALLLLTLGAGALYLYSDYQELELSQTISILQMGLISVALCFTAILALRQVGNALQLSAVMGLCFVLAFALIPNQAQDYSELTSLDSVVERGESAVDIIVLAFKEEQFNVSDFMSKLQLEFGSVALDQVDFQVIDRADLNNESLALRRLGLATLGRAKAVILSDSVLKYFANDKHDSPVLSSESRAKVNFEYLLSNSSSNQKAIRGESFTKQQLATRRIFRFLEQLQQQLPDTARLLVIDRGGDILQLNIPAA